MKEGAELRLKMAQDLGPAIVAAAEIMLQCLRAGGKLLFFGNGGSAADAQHLAAEFVGRFVLERRGLPAIALTTDSSILTAIGNDYGYERVFSRQIEALGQAGDVAFGISASGNSPNVIAAMELAKKQNLKTIGLSGRDGGLLAKCVDVPITVASSITARVQEGHIAIGHLLCELVENELHATGMKIAPR
ncbi:MAG TPA: D-sedoheptulose 7-phosphate isomerase [Verrucomicrobiae bacterium]|nr:D-sedoheptulose 7-phosphate isomerase [Verrucomicrobiae bacterium]